MIVVADTSPINYLVLVDEIDVLPKLFREIVIPFGVLAELQRDETPEKVREFIKTRPAWLKVETVNLEFESELAKLGCGEHEAIVLAEKLQANLLIIDDRAGRTEALRRGLRTVGTIFVLQKAAQAEMLNLRETLEKLQRTNFRISEKILEEILEKFYK